jgi:hypothetical protein
MSLVGTAHSGSLGHPFSTPLPRGRRMFTVSLLPSGPEPVPVTAGRRSLRSVDPCPPASQDEASTSGRTRLPRIARAVLGLRPPHADGFGSQVTPSHPG